MSASITDYFSKASNMNGSYPAVATVTAARSAGASTLSCDDLSSWTTDTPVHFSTFKVNADGTIDKTTQTDWKGIVNGNTITDMTRLAGAADSGNTSGERVELNPTIGWLDDLITGILVSHKQDGTLKDNVVSTTKIADEAVTADKVDFTTMKKWVPDYANRGGTNILTGSGNAISITESGWIDFHEIYKYSSSSGNAYLRVSVNDKEIIRLVSPTSRDIQYSGMLPVEAGDTVKVYYNLDAAAPRAYFIPGKWA